MYKVTVNGKEVIVNDTKIGVEIERLDPSPDSNVPFIKVSASDFGDLEISRKSSESDRYITFARIEQHDYNRETVYLVANDGDDVASIELF